MGMKEAIEAIARSLALPTEDFEEVGIYEWEPVMKKIETQFVIKQHSNTRFNWWWESLKGETYSLDFKQDNGYEFLDKQIAQEEQVWFIATDDEGQDNKFWLFEGKIEPIQRIIGEMPYFEYYIVSKKYYWMLCENHHGVFIGVGTQIINKLKALGTELLRNK